LIFSIVSSDPEPIINFVNSFGVFAYVAFVFLATIEVVIAPMPPLVLYAAGGLLFGGFLGGILSLVGNILGSLIAFFLARSLARNYFEKKIPIEEKERFDYFSKKYGGLAIFFLRINPLTSSDIFSYIAGLTKMSTKSFTLGTLLGLAPLVFFQTYLGHQINNSPFLTLMFILVGIVYLVIFMYGVFFALHKNRQEIIRNKNAEKKG